MYFLDGNIYVNENLMINLKVRERKIRNQLHYAFLTVIIYNAINN